MSVRLWGAAAVSVCGFLAAGRAHAQTEARITTFPGAAWETRMPSDVGLDPNKLGQLALLVGGSGLIIKDGYLVRSWGPQTTKRDWLSAAKPVTSTLLKFAVQEGLLASENALVDPFVVQEFGRALEPKDSNITFRHLANMTSGYALPNDPGPGMRWGYNDYGIKLYSLLLARRVFGDSLNVVATHPSRLGALQFQDGSIYSTRQGLGVYTTPRDFARIGWLWLNRGYWNGTQLLSDQAFDVFLSIGVDGGTPQTDGGLVDYLGVGTYGGGTNQTSAGPGVYGFNLWTNKNGALWPDAPHDTYQANGGWNQHAVTVIPSLKVVAVWSNSVENHPEDFASPMNQALALLTESADVPFNVPAGWSHLSVPVRTADMSVAALVDDPNGVAFRFVEGRYVRVDTLEVGLGYLAHSQGVAKTLRGEHVLPHRVPITQGWKLVGVFDNHLTSSEISSDPPGIIDDHVVATPQGFGVFATALAPGRAYWVRASDDGHLVYLNEPAPSKHRQGVPTSNRKRKEPLSELERSPPSHTGSVSAPEGPR
ncbi:MAG TPA: serine hydrolase [Rhodothermia bacterium]